MKKCIKCKNEKMLKDFYKPAQMKDLPLNKCKSCCKDDATINYHNNIEQYKDYDIKRNKTVARKIQKAVYQRNTRIKYPEKYIARTAVNNALRDNRLTKQSCKVCGSVESNAHHTDYSKPLDVI